MRRIVTVEYDATAHETTDVRVRSFDIKGEETFFADHPGLKGCTFSTNMEDAVTDLFRENGFKDVEIMGYVTDQ